MKSSPARRPSHSGRLLAGEPPSHDTPFSLRLVAAVLLLGCPACAGDAPGADGGSFDGGSVDAAPPPSAFAAPAAPACPGRITGAGMVWLDDPQDMTLVERPLHCLEGDGSLRGAFVSSVRGPPDEPAAAADHSFAYPVSDGRLQQVQAYYVVTAMAGHFQDQLRLSGPLPPIELELQADQGMATSRYRYVPRKIWLGLVGIRPHLISAQILGHEYAHHLILNHVPEPDQILNEALADYLVADFTGRPLVVTLARLELPADVVAAVADEAPRLIERSVDNRWRYPADAITRAEQCAFHRRLAALLPPDAQLLTPEQLGKCDQLDDEELAAHEPHLTGRIVAGALWDLRRQLSAPVVTRLLFEAMAARAPIQDLAALVPGLLAADEAAFGGQHTSTIHAVFASRGLPGS